MPYIRKADRPAFEAAVADAMLAIRPEVVALREVLPAALHGGDCPDHLFDAVFKEVMTRVAEEVFVPLLPPLLPPG